MKSTDLTKLTIILFIKAVIYSLIVVVLFSMAGMVDQANSLNAASAELSQTELTSTNTPTPTPTPLVISPFSPLETATPTAIPTATPTPTLTPTPIEPTPPQPAETLFYTARAVKAYPHDREAWTQGLIIEDGVLYEGTGLHGSSSLRRVDLETGNILQFLALPPVYFGEGITVFGDKIIQLTWKQNTGFVYDKDTFEFERMFTYPTEGWGLTHDGERLIMSDGTANLYFWDPETLSEIGRVEVYDENGPVVKLNELEYINGEVYANVWQTNRIARIDSETGRVLGWIQVSGLLTVEDVGDEPVGVLNGIAYDAETERLFITGKLWPKIFEIELVLEE